MSYISTTCSLSADVIILSLAAFAARRVDTSRRPTGLSGRNAYVENAEIAVKGHRATDHISPKLSNLYRVHRNTFTASKQYTNSYRVSARTSSGFTGKGTGRAAAPATFTERKRGRERGRNRQIGFDAVLLKERYPSAFHHYKFTGIFYLSDFVYKDR